MKENGGESDYKELEHHVGENNPLRHLSVTVTTKEDNLITIAFPNRIKGSHYHDQGISMLLLNSI